VLILIVILASVFEDEDEQEALLPLLMEYTGASQPGQHMNMVVISAYCQQLAGF
jgi:hypothetical protein